MSREDVRREVRLFVEQHARDGLLYMDCPECGKHNKLMVGPAEEGGHWYKCLSDGCPTFGTTETYIPNAGTDVPKSGTTRRIYIKVETDPVFEITGRQWLQDRFALGRRQTTTLCKGKLGHRYVYPIWSPDGKARGYVSRSYDRNDQNKSLLRPYVDVPVPLISWYWPIKRLSVHPVFCIVEDQVSAVRLSQYFPTVALLGTSIDRVAEEEIRRTAGLYNCTKLVVLLDNDASYTALKLANKFSNGHCVPLFDQDIKDMPEHELRELVEVLRG